MLEKVLTYLGNWFETDRKRGSFAIAGGSLDLPYMKDGQYYRIVGSVFNDGLHKHPEFLMDEEFEGEVWPLAVPAVIIDLSEEIAEWKADNAKALNSPYSSESFGGYSYTKPTSNAAQGASDGWKQHFASELSGWMKL